MLKPRALDHVGLVVGDLDRSLDFYCRALGLELLRRKDTSAVLRVGAQEINVFCGSATAASGAVIDHFCLEVDAGVIDDVVRDLAAAGVALAKPPVERRDGVSLFVSDPDGCRVELIVKRPSGANS